MGCLALAVELREEGLEVVVGEFGVWFQHVVFAGVASIAQRYRSRFQAGGRTTIQVCRVAANKVPWFENSATPA